MVYNLTGIAQNGTSVLGFVQGVNDQLMLGWLGIFLLIGIAIVIFTSFTFATNDVKKALPATLMITFVLAILMKAMDLIRHDMVLYIVFISLAASVAFTWKRT